MRRINIFTILSLQILEHGIAIHLFRSSLIFPGSFTVFSFVIMHPSLDSFLDIWGFQKLLLLILFLKFNLLIIFSNIYKYNGYLYIDSLIHLLTLIVYMFFWVSPLFTIISPGMTVLQDPFQYLYHLILFSCFVVLTGIN